MMAFVRNTEIKKNHLFALLLFTVVTGGLIFALDTNQGLLQTSQNPSSSNAQSTPNVTVDYTQTIQNLSPLAFGMDETGYGTPNVLANDTTEQQKVKTLGLGYMRMDLMYATSGNSNSKIECGGSGCDTNFTGDQWVNAIKAAGAQPVIGVHESINKSEGINTIQDAANMVKHFNKDTNNYVKYWIIGNEPDINNITQQQYSADFNAYYDAMKAVDPTILIGGPATAFYDSPNCSTCFLEVFLQSSGSRVDFLDFHGYPQQGNVNGSYSTLFSWATQQGQYVANLRSLIQTYVPSRASQIGIEVGEWELNWGGSAQDNINFHAVWAADVLGNILSNGGDSMFYGTKGNLLYSNSQSITDQTGSSFQVNTDDTNPAYHGYGMFTGEGLFRHFGTSMVKTSTNVANVDVFASNNPKNIVVINKDPTNSATITVNIIGVTSGTVDVWRKDNSMKSTNPPVSLGSQSFQNNTFTYTLTPFSVTTFLVNPGTTPTPTPTPKPTNTPTPSPTSTALIPYGQSSNWNIVFNDEFNNNSIDLTKWTPNWFGGSNTALSVPVNSNATNCFDPAQSTEGNGELDLTAKLSSCTIGNNTYPYRSGMLSSNGKYSFTYGYMEARIWLPGTTGTWPAFWSDGQNWPQTGEIDTLETWANGDQEYHYHYGNSATSYGPGGGTTVSGAFSGWHTYATDWEPGIVKWYYDGKLVWQLTNADLTSGYSITSSPQYLILFLQLDSNPSTVPTTMKVDYVRVWQKSTTPTPTPVPTTKPSSTPTPTPTPTPKPTSNPSPTSIPTATPTPIPTNIASSYTFTTSFETGQTQPSWTNTVDSGGYPSGGIYNVGGVNSSLSGPESGVRSELTHSGSAALMYSGKDNSTASSYAYMKILDLSSNPLLVSSNTTLSYWIYPQSSSNTYVSGNNSSCVAIDLVYSDGTNLRDSGSVDQNGNRLHPSSQCNHLTLDKWNNVISNIGAQASGKKIIRIDIGYDQAANTGGYRGYLDDISINTNNPVSASPASQSVNLLQNGNFVAQNSSTSWLSPWLVHSNSGYVQWWQSSASVNGYPSFTEYTSQLPINYWDIQLQQGGISLQSGKTYTISFYAKGDVSNRPLQVIEQLDASPWTTYFTKTIYLTTSFQNYTMTFTSSVTSSNTFMGFNFGLSTGQVWINEVSMTSN